MATRHARYISTQLQLLAALVLVIIMGKGLWLTSHAPLLQTQHSAFQVHTSTASTRLPASAHPIDTLIIDADKTFRKLLIEQQNDLNSAAAAYRQRRGFHPPPNFDKWFEYAQLHNAVIVEELFDRIYHDLNPFWGVPVATLRGYAQHFEPRIYVRNGTASIAMNMSVETETTTVRTKAWLSLVQSIEHLLPDLDMALNTMDASRVIAPWGDVNRSVEIGGKARQLHNLSQVISTYSSLESLNETQDDVPDVDFVSSGQEPFWHIARTGCTPNAPARHVNASNHFRGPAPFQQGNPANSFHEYAKNWTHVRDPCQQPILQEAHGMFIEPMARSTTQSLVPIFGEVKLSMSNDILIPPIADLAESFYNQPNSSAGALGMDWASKIAGIVWRGAASGGRSTKKNWTRFQRHRFVSMLNGTYIQNVMQDPRAGGEGKAFVLPSPTIYNLNATEYMSISTWLDRIANVDFTDLVCFPKTVEPTCNYTDPFFKIASPISLLQQFKYKVLPDIDGDSISGRYLELLRSTSVPIKATIFSAWHDDRLIPWLHFVPMDQSFVDIYGILDYFFGIGSGFRTDDGQQAIERSHDDEARKIALSGKDWAEKVLRREDMEIYMLRLLLEYARLCDDSREKLGFVADLEATPADSTGGSPSPSVETDQWR